MSSKNIKLRNGMTRDEINKSISEWITLEDDVYMGNNCKHNWKCKCGNIIKGRRWANIYNKINHVVCDECKYNEIEQKYRYEVEKDGEYEYIRSYRKGDTLPNGTVVGDRPYIQVKHIYCGNIYEVQAGQFINMGKRCGKCCQKYENSFAYHIEVELEESLDKYWDFEKNTVNPYHIYKNSNGKAWIKCQKKDYHGSYLMLYSSFVSGSRCPYCNSKKIHPKDSFAQYHIDNTDPDFLDKYWDWGKNNISPWEISKNSTKRIWVKCQEKDYHKSYDINCDAFTQGGRCTYCHPTGNSYKVHPYDSFGYHHFDKVLSWHPDNDISPFRVANHSNKIYKFLCDSCLYEFSKTLANINVGQWCPYCSSSKGEKTIKSWLDENNIFYIHDEPYFKDLLSDKGNPLRPDFILPDNKIWIEYDGEFHYKDIYKDGRLKIQQRYDKRKDEYAKKHGWKLIRIPYWEFDNIENILKGELN